MSGERDLHRLLAGMEPVQRPGAFVFVAGEPGLAGEAEATVREPEGLSAVLTRERADALGLDYDFVAAWITLRVHSALDAVGLTAAVSAALAGAGMSCNIVAGRLHDHLLVPADRAPEALAILRAMSSEAASGR
jgi:hypothetical protein